MGNIITESKTGNKIIDKIKVTEKDFIEIRHYLHQNPELGLEEVNTSNLVAKKLEEWGYEVHKGLAKTGVIGSLKVGNGTKTIGIRADMDALPIIEDSGKPWTSKVHGKFHGCGHDGHTTILLCAAKYLAENKNFNGTVHLIFQPAEETLFGGKFMVEEGMFNLFPCDIIFGIHNMPGYEKGKFYFREGAMMASSDVMDVIIKGKSAHASTPQDGIDATIIACHVALALQTIVSRNVSPFDQAVLTIGSIKSGETHNVISDTAIIKLTVRTLKKEVREMILKRIPEIVSAQAQSFGAQSEVKHLIGSPVLINGKEATQFASKIAEEMFGKDRVLETPAFMGSEDFAFMLDTNPNGCYMIIGAGNEPDRANVHNPKYDFNDECIVPAAAFWVAITEAYLK